jgi:hypothetical protein
MDEKPWHTTLAARARAARVEVLSAALCKDSDRIEVVTHAEYLDDTNKFL